MDEKLPYPVYIRKSGKSMKDGRGGRFKPPPSNYALKRGLPNIEIYYDFLDREKRMANVYRKTFKKSERIIVFCRIVLGWGSGKMTKRLGIPDSQIRKCYQKLRELA